MKILVSTIIDNINFGTYLQAFATSYLLQKRGAEVELLNYIRPYLDTTYYAKKILKDESRSFPIRVLKSILYIILGNLEIRNVKKFLKSKVKLTSKIQSLQELQTLSKKEYDLFLTGSDQVWNSQHNLGIDPIFFFEGVKGRKASLAASVGLNSFENAEKYRIKSLLTEYTLISVRESYGKDAIEDLGIDGNQIEQVLDPTLFISSNEWQNISRAKFKKTEKYLLIYSVEVGKDDIVQKIAKKIAKEKGLKTYLVSATPKNRRSVRSVDRAFTFASVDMFLSLMANADYVVCSSFHGTAFAINFNKQFVTIAPERFNTRVNSILKLLHLQNRYVESECDIPDEEIDYKEVDKLLESEREKSERVLNRIIEIK